MKKTNVNDIAYNYAELDLALIVEDAYDKLTPRDIIVFTMLKNQESLSFNSVKHGNMDYVDQDGNIFIRIAQKKLAKILRMSEPTLRSSLKVLEEHDLIEISKAGKNQCSKMYIGTPERNTSYKDYVVKIGLEIESEKEEKEKNQVSKNKNLNVKNIKEDNKKDLPAPTDKPNKKYLKNNFDSNIISENSNKIQYKNENLETIKILGIEIPKKLDKKTYDEINKWDKNKMYECLKYIIDNDKLGDRSAFEYLKTIYSNPIFLKPSNKQLKTRYHNINQRIDKYEEDELESILKDNEEIKAERRKLKELQKKESDANINKEDITNDNYKSEFKFKPSFNPKY